MVGSEKRMMSTRVENMEVLGDLFKDVKYYVVGSIASQVEKLLLDGGARKSMYLADMVTIAISDDVHNCEVEEARDVFDIPVVTSRWIVLSAKCGAKLPTVGFKADGNQLFWDVVTCSTQLSIEDVNAVWAMITFYGGRFQTTLDKRCTHLISGAAEGKKYRAALQRGIKIVTPDWVVDAVKEKTRADEARFHPRLLQVDTPADIDTSTNVQFANLAVGPETQKVEPVLVPKDEKVSMPPRTTSCTVTVSLSQPQNRGSVNVTWSKDCVNATGSGLAQNIVSVGQGMPIRSGQPLNQLQQQQNAAANSWDAQQLQCQQQKMQELLVQQQQQLAKQRQVQPRSNATVWQRTPNAAAVDGSLQRPNQLQVSQLRAAMQPQLAQQQQQQRAATPQQFQQQQRAWLMTQGREGAPQLGQPRPPLQMQQAQWQQPQARDPGNQLVGQPQPSLPNTWPQNQQQSNQPGAVKTISHAVAVQRKVQWQQQQQPQLLVQQQNLQLQQQNQQLQVQQKMGNPEIGENANAVPAQQHLQWQRNQQQQVLIRENIRLQQQQQLLARGDCGQQTCEGATKTQQQTVMNPQQQRPMSVSRVSAPSLVNFQVAAGGPRPNLAAAPNQGNVLTVAPPQAQQPLPHDRLHHVVQQGQQQIQQQLQSLQAQAQLSQPTALTAQSQQVTPKTKTALAIMLNTRLQNSPRLSDLVEMSGQPPVANVATPTSTAAVLPRSTSGEVTGYQSTLRNITNSCQVSPTKNAKPEAVHTSPRPAQRDPAQAQPQVPFVQYYGHDPSLTVPADRCLSGCVFFIADYDRSVSSEEIGLWKKVIGKHNGQVEASYGAACTHVLCDNLRNSVVQQAMREGKRCVTAYWLNDVLLQKRLRPPWMALHFPTPFADDKPCKVQKISVSLFEGEERAHLKAMIHQCGAEYTGYMTRKNTILICRKAEGIKYEKAREWDMSIVNVQWLHDILFGHLEAMRLPLAHKYQQFALDNPFAVDYALVPHLMTAWKFPIQIPEESWKKMVASSGLSSQIKERQNEDAICSAPKRPRLSPELEENVPLTTNFPPLEANKPFVMFTGIADSKALARNVLQLGGVLTTSCKQCTHLITDALGRTVKLLCAISNCKFILTRNWIVDSFKQNRFADEKAYILTDYKNEKHFGCNIRQTLFRSSRTPIFSGLSFYVTPGVRPCFSIMKEIIECAGGTVCKKKPSKSELLLANTHGPKMIVVSCDNDIHLCQSWVQHKIPIQNAEFVLTGVMKQEADYQSFLIPSCAPTSV